MVKDCDNFKDFILVFFPFSQEQLLNPFSHSLLQLGKLLHAGQLNASCLAGIPEFLNS